MIVKEQKEIELVNACGAILREEDLKGAILWYSAMFFDGKPVAQKKSVFMHGKYPAVSIHGVKMHVHRLLYSFLTGRFYFKDEYVHHKNGDKLDNRRENLELMKAADHQSLTNKGRKQSPEHVAKRTASMKKTRYENPELLKS